MAKSPKKIAALMLVKGQSNRLPNKNSLLINGEPMYVVNLKKCLKLFKKVYVSSEDDLILVWAKHHGALMIKRPVELCGDTPNIPVYRHAMEQMDCDAFVAVQANSPTVELRIIRQVKELLNKHQEVITVHPDNSIYGSIWGMRKVRLEEYEDFYNPHPDAILVDNSLDIHTQEDYDAVVQQLSNG